MSPPPNREYIPDSTVVSLHIHALLTRSYMENGKQKFEILKVIQEDKVAKINSEEMQESIKLAEKGVEDSLSNWDLVTYELKGEYDD